MKTIQLKDILAISGKGGLFKFIAQARNGIVVESLEDQKRHVAPATARVSSLEDIAIFTTDEEVPLADIFFMVHEKSEGKETTSHKAPVEELKSQFKELVPEYDEDRVYVSDIKKVFQWYNQLHKHQLLEVIDKEEEQDEDKSADQKEEQKEAPAEKPGKGADKPKTSAEKAGKEQDKAK
jgi:hypothetical protein